MFNIENSISLGLPGKRYYDVGAKEGFREVGGVLLNPHSLHATPLGGGINGMPRRLALPPPILSTPGRIEQGVRTLTESKSVKFWTGNYGRSFGPMARFAIPAMIWGGIALVAGVGSQLKKSMIQRPVDRSGSLSMGPGFISWGKTAGLPANNLSTQGLSLSLSNMRHSSIM